MKKFLYLFLLAVFAIGATDHAPSGLIKTQFKKWEQKKFTDMGFSLDIPSQPAAGMAGGYFIEEFTNPKIASKLGYKMINLKLNPVWKGSYDIEPYYLIGISICRLNNENYLKYKAGNHRIISYDQFTENYGNFYNEFESYHKEKVPGYEGREKDYYLILRKDYQAPNGDYVLCGAKLYAGSEKFIEPSKEDIDAVKRILMSVQFKSN